MQGVVVEELTLGCPRPNALGRLCAPRFSWAWFSWASSHLDPGLMQLRGVAASGPLRAGGRRGGRASGSAAAASGAAGAAPDSVAAVDVGSAAGTGSAAGIGSAAGAGVTGAAATGVGA